MAGQPPAEKLRTIAALFDEHIHLVALADSGIESVKVMSIIRIGKGQ